MSIYQNSCKMIRKTSSNRKPERVRDFVFWKWEPWNDTKFSIRNVLFWCPFTRIYVKLLKKKYRWKSWKGWRLWFWKVGTLKWYKIYWALEILCCSLNKKENKFKCFNVFLANFCWFKRSFFPNSLLYLPNDFF